MTRSLSYHLRCRSEGEGKRQAGGGRESERERGGERGRTGGTGSTGSGSDGTDTHNTLNPKAVCPPKRKLQPLKIPVRLESISAAQRFFR